jgi:hypothetical protein
LIVARVLLLLVTFAALATWAGAQAPPAPLTAAEQAKLFKLDRALLDNLINQSIDLADADNPLKRAEECRKTSLTLGNYLERAAKDEQDPDRVAELADLLGKVVREGLTHNLELGKQLFPPGSPDAARLNAVREHAATDLDALKNTIPEGKIADNAKVKAALARLAELKAALAK